MYLSVLARCPQLTVDDVAATSRRRLLTQLATIPTEPALPDDLAVALAAQALAVRLAGTVVVPSFRTPAGTPPQQRLSHRWTSDCAAPRRICITRSSAGGAANRRVAPRLQERPATKKGAR